MAIVIFSILFILALAAYAFMSLGVNKTFVQCVEAGSTKSITAEELRKKSLFVKSKTMLDCSGKKLSSKDFFRVVVNGNCLSERGINDKDLLIVKNFTDSDKPSLQTGKIILLYIEDTGIYKIREIKSLNNTEIITRYYLDNGTPQDSSKPHNITQVKGIVMYKL